MFSPDIGGRELRALNVSSKSKHFLTQNQAKADGDPIGFFYFNFKKG